MRVSVYDMSERQSFLSSVCVSVIRTSLSIYLCVCVRTVVFLLMLCGVLND